MLVVVVRGAWFGSEWRAGLLHRGIGEDDCMRERRPLSWAGGKGGRGGLVCRSVVEGRGAFQPSTPQLQLLRDLECWMSHCRVMSEVREKSRGCWTSIQDVLFNYGVLFMILISFWLLPSHARQIGQTVAILFLQFHCLCRL